MHIKSDEPPSPEVPPLQLHLPTSLQMKHTAHPELLNPGPKSAKKVKKLVVGTNHLIRRGIDAVRQRAMGVEELVITGSYKKGS